MAWSPLRLLPLLTVLAASPAPAAPVELTGSFGSLSVPLTTLQEQRYANVVRQRFDFSCGAAALATLLTHHYDHPLDERTALNAMVAKGEVEKIRRAGFSLADMKGYLEDRGFSANGFRVRLDEVTKAGVPVIALMDTKGYRHFVVVRGIEDGRVLVADPALGARIVPRAEFEAGWNGVVLAIISHRDQGRRRFNLTEHWRLQPPGPMEETLRQGLPGLPVSTFSRDFF